MSNFTTKRKLAQQVHRRISGGDVSDDSEYDEREIILFIEQAMAVLVKDNFIKTLLVAETTVGTQYISVSRDVAVLKDDGLGLAYSNIPHKYLDLHQDRGIHHISMMKSQDEAFVPTRNGSMSLYSKSPANFLEGRIGYWTEGNRVYYRTDLLSLGCSKVLMKLIVPAPSDLDDDDPYPIASDMELPVINMVLGLMGVRVETDDVNDNTNK